MVSVFRHHFNAAELDVANIAQLLGCICVNFLQSIRGDRLRFGIFVLIFSGALAQAVPSVCADQPGAAIVAQSEGGVGNLSAEIQSLIQELGADEFNRRRKAFLQLWQMGEPAVSAVKQAKDSSDLQIAQAAVALEPLLLLRVSPEDLAEDVFDLVVNPSPLKITELCERGYWELAAQILKSNETLVIQFRDSVGTFFLNHIAQAALEQNVATRCWPIVQIVTRPPAATYDGSDLGVWLAAHLELELDTQIEPSADEPALRLLYADQPLAALELNISDTLRRKILTRTGRWTDFHNDLGQSLVLRGSRAQSGQAAQAVLLEFSGNRIAADRIWEQLLRQEESEKGEQEEHLDAPEKGGREGDTDARIASQLLSEQPAVETNQMILALLASGRPAVVAQYFRDTNTFAAFSFLASAADYVSVFELMGLEQDLSNFQQWLATQGAVLELEAAKPLARGGSEVFEQAAHFCNLLVGLGFRDEAIDYFDAIVRAADQKSNIWEYSIIRWMDSAESRQVALDVLGRYLNKFPTDIRRIVLAGYFPEFENTLPVLQTVFPRLTTRGDGAGPSVLEALDKLHSWDVRYFEQLGISVADWLVLAERQLIAAQANQQPSMFVLQMAELAEAARGCGLEDLALQFAMSDLVSVLNPDFPQSQRMVAAKIFLERGEAEEAAAVLSELRSVKNASNDPHALVLEVKALLLSGRYQEAMELDRSRWLRPLATTRFYRGASYLQATYELLQEGEMSAAREYAELAFQMADFSSMDLYWSASVLAEILEEQDDLVTSADVLRAALVEALQPGSPQLDYQKRNLHLHYLRNAINKERIHRAAACILSGQWTDAEFHMQFGERLQPQDIEMVVACYPRLVEAGQSAMADRLFDSYEANMLRQIAIWPNDAMALNNLAWMYTQCDRKLEDALRLAEKVVLLAPNSAVYLDTLAEVHYRSGRVEEAVETMQECVRLDPRENHYRANLIRFGRGEE